MKSRNEEGKRKRKFQDKLHMAELKAVTHRTRHVRHKAMRLIQKRKADWLALFVARNVLVQES